ncbi:hypothetical protein AB0A05_16095 [Streptomyces sp. NPDC046374]|uniref:hypothetical protein n=1 Tax=Streptomyces sp. NPDC046374 TaxID=3154917 RepID=UPI0033C9F575
MAFDARAAELLPDGTGATAVTFWSLVSFVLASGFATRQAALSGVVSAQAGNWTSLSRAPQSPP